MVEPVTTTVGLVVSMFPSTEIVNELSAGTSVCVCVSCLCRWVSNVENFVGLHFVASGEFQTHLKSIAHKLRVRPTPNKHHTHTHQAHSYELLNTYSYNKEWALF